MNAQATPHLGSELLQEVTNSLRTLSEIARHRERMGEEPVNLALRVVSDAKRRIDRKELFVCVVGEKKVGKSTFLNAILGRPILSTAVRECTGAVTMIRAFEQAEFRVTLNDGKVLCFADVFRDRRAQYTRLQQRFEQRARKCTQQAVELPRNIEQLKSSVAFAENEVVRLTADYEAAVERHQCQRQELCQKKEALIAFERRLTENDKAVPYAFRRPPTWYNPIRWSMQKFGEKNAKPEWKKHVHSYRELQASKRDVADFEEVVADTAQSERDVRQQLDGARSRRTGLGQQLAHSMRLLADLPARTQACIDRRASVSESEQKYKDQRDQAFNDAIRAFTDIEKRGSEVHLLEIGIPTDVIPKDLVVIDTPGVNTDNEDNRARAWKTIRNDADGCIVLSDIQQSVSQSTRDFVREVKGFLPHIILVLTKLDRAIESAEFDGESAIEQVEEARRIGEQRFASEVGRSPGDILSFAVSAQRALAQDDPVAAQRFAQDTKTIADLLRNERALIVAARCAATINTVQAQIAQAQEAAEVAYARQIHFLETNRIPDPDAFCRSQLRLVDEALDCVAESTIRSGVHLIDSAYNSMAESYCNEIFKCTSGEQLKEYLGRMQGSLQSHFRRVNRAIQKELAKPTSRAIRDLEEPLLRALREKYQIVNRVYGSAATKVQSSSLGVRNVLPEINLNLSGLVQEFQNNKVGGIAGGAITGATVGSVIPGIGTLVGGLVGGVLGGLFGPSFEEVRYECAQRFVGSMAQAKSEALERFSASETRIARELRSVMQAALSEAIRKYGRWIDQLIQNERDEIAAERENLAHLQRLKERMAVHQVNLDRLMSDARQLSKGLAT